MFGFSFSRCKFGVIWASKVGHRLRPSKAPVICCFSSKFWYHAKKKTNHCFLLIKIQLSQVSQLNIIDFLLIPMPSNAIKNMPYIDWFALHVVHVSSRLGDGQNDLRDAGNTGGAWPFLWHFRGFNHQKKGNLIWLYMMFTVILICIIVLYIYILLY